MQVLKAITIDAACQYREEATKGSFEAGKHADLIVLGANPLGANPLTVKPMAIKDIKIVEPIKDRQTIHKAGERS